MNQFQPFPSKPNEKDSKKNPQAEITMPLQKADQEVQTWNGGFSTAYTWTGLQRKYFS